MSQEADVDEVFDSRLGAVAKMVNTMLALEAEAAQLEEEAAARREVARKLSMVDIPTMFGDLGISGFTRPDGSKVSVKAFVKAAIPADSLGEAVAWLDSVGAGDLVKSTIATAIAREDHVSARAAVEALKALGLTVERKDSVHWATLTAWCKDKLADGEELPAKLLGLEMGMKTYIKYPRSSSNSKGGD
jgi:hypothetical protein